MRFLINITLMAVIALLIGFGLSYYALVDGRLLGAFEYGSWVTRPNIGSPEPDPYSRSYLARNVSLHLSRGEGIEFRASVDSEGEPLVRSCSYRMAGTTPVAAFWTLRAENSESVNVGAAGALSHMHSKRLARQSDGSFVINVGTTIKPENWLELQGDGPYELILTFYDASFFAGFGTTIRGLPAIEREEC